MKQYQYRVTADQQTGEVIERLASLTGVSPAKIIRQWLTEASPALAFVADTLEAARAIEAEAKSSLRSVFDREDSKVDALHAEMLHVMQRIKSEVDQAREPYAVPLPASASARRARSVQPPTCNTGATNVSDRGSV